MNPTLAEPRPSRREWQSQPDSVLLQQCDIDTYRASGPGGQKRNKTSSAVRLRHRPSGLIVIAEESRSQNENKAKCLKRLRQAFALHWRDGVLLPDADLASAVDADGRFAISAKHPAFWPAAGVVLDLLAACEGQVSTSAERLGTSTANLLAFLAEDPKLWQEAKRLRVAFGHKPLKPHE